MPTIFLDSLPLPMIDICVGPLLRAVEATGGPDADTSMAFIRRLNPGDLIALVICGQLVMNNALTAQAMRDLGARDISEKDKGRLQRHLLQLSRLITRQMSELDRRNQRLAREQEAAPRPETPAEDGTWIDQPRTEYLIDTPSDQMPLQNKTAAAKVPSSPYAHASSAYPAHPAPSP